MGDLWYFVTGLSRFGLAHYNEQFSQQVQLLGFLR